MLSRRANWIRICSFHLYYFCKYIVLSHIIISNCFFSLFFIPFFVFFGPEGLHQDINNLLHWIVLTWSTSVLLQTQQPWLGLQLWQANSSYFSHQPFWITKGKLLTNFWHESAASYHCHAIIRISKQASAHFLIELTHL